MARNIKEFNYKTRNQNLEIIPDQTFDLLIIGGGITGAGVFRDACLHGVSTLLCEANDFAFGTSSRSTKLIHGGIRYLQNLEFHLVFESLNERLILNRLAPHLVKPLEFYLPVFKSNPVPSWKIRLGLFLYDLLALFRSPRTHRKISKKTLFNFLQDGLQSVFSYFDYWTDDARLTLENIIDGHEHAGVALNYTRVTKVTKMKNGFQVELNNKIKVFAKKIFNATGPDSDVVRSLIEGTSPELSLAPTKGVHVVVSKERLNVDKAFLLNVPKDDRIAFFIPWSKNTIIGTTDTYSKDSQSKTSVTKEDVDYLLTYTNYFFPKAHLTEKDIISSWVGLRPLVKPEQAVLTGKISREEKLWFEPEGCLHMIGGKLTTYRKVSEKIMKMLGFKSSHLSKKFKLPGGNSNRYPFGSRFEIIDGIEKEFPELSSPLSPNTDVKKSWVYFCLRYEMAIHLPDIMIRRFGIYYRQPSGGLEEARAILLLMKDFNPETDIQQELQSYVDWVNMINAYKKPITIEHSTLIEKVI